MMEKMLVITLNLVIVMQVIVLTREARMEREQRRNIVAETKRILENLIPVAIGLIFDRRTPAHSSPSERFYILKEIYDRVPDKHKPYITTSNLDEIIDHAYYEVHSFLDKEEY